jgi:hypothetical protein
MHHTLLYYEFMILVTVGMIMPYISVEHSTSDIPSLFLFGALGVKVVLI